MRDVGGGRGNLYPLCHHVVVVRVAERIRYVPNCRPTGFVAIAIFVVVVANIYPMRAACGARVFESVVSSTAAPLFKWVWGGVDLTVYESSSTTNCLPRCANSSLKRAR